MDCTVLTGGPEHGYMGPCSWGSTPEELSADGPGEGAALLVRALSHWVQTITQLAAALCVPAEQGPWACYAGDIYC